MHCREFRDPRIPPAIPCYLQVVAPFHSAEIQKIWIITVTTFPLSSRDPIKLRTQTVSLIILCSRLMLDSSRCPIKLISMLAQEKLCTSRAFLENLTNLKRISSELHATATLCSTSGQMLQQISLERSTSEICDVQSNKLQVKLEEVSHS